MKKHLVIITAALWFGIADAMAQSKLVSIYKKGISITSKDSAFYLKPSVRIQSRFETSGVPGGSADWNSNFLIRRARIKFAGWVISPKLAYKFQLGVAPSNLKSSSDFKETGGAAKIVLDAVVKWKFHKNFALWVGQTKLPGNREELVSSQKQEFVDRSESNGIFKLDRDLGVQLHAHFHAGPVSIRPTLAFAKGDGRNIISNNIGGFSYTGKLEVLPLGDFTSKGDYSEADLKREPKPKLALAGAVNFNQGAARQKQSGVFLLDTGGNYLTNDLLTVFADMMFKVKGFSLLAEYTYKTTLLKPGQALSILDSTIVSADGKSAYIGQGVNVQAGYLFKHNWELAVRYTKVIPEWKKSFKGGSEYMLGLSKYIVGHKLKVQSDVTLMEPDLTSDLSLRYRLQMEFAF